MKTDQDNPTARKLLLPLGLALGIGFALAGLWLLLLGFEVGEVYPAYSTLRADPDGTEVFFEAAERLGSIRAERSYLPLTQVQPTSGSTFVVAGISPIEWERLPKTDASALRAMVERGARVVFAFESTTGRPDLSNLETSKSKPKPKPKEETKTSRGRKQPEKGAAEKIFQFRFKLDPPPGPKAKPRTASLTPEAQPELALLLPKTIRWPGLSHLEPLDPSWSTLLQLENGGPVALERKLGKGSIVVLADSYLLTNEAMWKSRQTGLLIWLIGSGNRLIFDESHLGVSDQPGLTSLVARYRLHGALAAILLVFALFVWRHSCPLVPASAQPSDTMQAGPAESVTSLAALVRRAIPESQLLAVSVQEWKRSARVDQETIARAEAIARQAGSQSVLKRDLVHAYGEIRDELGRKGLRGRRGE